MDALKADLDAFGISEEFGFVQEQQLTDLPDYYKKWLDLANNLTQLIESRELRDMVHRMPVLSPHLLTSYEELRLAHLVLGLITMGYVWQEKNTPAQVLPKTLALPFWLVSRRLGVPPILTYADVVLYNWKFREPTGNMDIGNLDLRFPFPGGETSRWFFIVSLLVEGAAGPGIMGALMVMRAMKTFDLDGVEKGLIQVTYSLKKMKELFALMHHYVDTAEFFGTTRMFFYGWKNSPLLPRGLLYEGVSDEPIRLSGLSAAQSSTIQCFDALLCIQHEDEAGAYLKSMRDYMPPDHVQLIEALSTCPSLRNFIFSRPRSDLRRVYNGCVSALVDFRNYHINTVAKYIIVPANQRCLLGGACVAQKKGSGGTNPLVFLKNVRDATEKSIQYDV
ncbi:indoleamine 2,3-dioxygenase 2-like [Cynoglossus semilaevis]|uniref:Indoleamine 2,3-dioxygenase 2-like n=1 Tax=Cynoglossus semilaevis TaxID=244447 RepID=A0A3P8WCR1_CYNSE|nr:indoleamine 2,3-dioxygenase 2-like [Cynoglossus semilaevis]XP_016892803.1 indoleamine 2,3-dioxygenase 2-like [Cynoglossus semilaevis]